MADGQIKGGQMKDGQMKDRGVPGDVKSRIAAEVERRAPQLVALSRAVHAHPEVAFEENRAAELLADLLEGAGHPVERGAYGLDTALAATIGDSGPCVAVCCEYDALPTIGHGCGHNIIAAAGAGAGLAAGALAPELGGRVKILGTPAEEGGGGKILMAESGAFADVDAAMMVHPADVEVDAMRAIAVRQLQADYRGAAAHAAAFPHRGRNALDAAVLGYTAVATLRQHIRDDERVHGIFTHGGDRPNIVPDRATTAWYVRAPELGRLASLEERVRAALASGAMATGCEVEIRETAPTYAELDSNEAILTRYRQNAARRGRHVGLHREVAGVLGSTDMGNISKLVPAIHPMIKVAPEGIPIHTPAFAEHSRGALADEAVVDGAVILAWTIADLWSEPGLLEAARAEHGQRRRSEPGEGGEP